MNTYTELENEVLDCIEELFEEGDYKFADEVLERMGDSKTVRGALGSLVKKGVIDINRDEEHGLLSIFDDEMRKRCGLAA